MVEEACTCDDLPPHDHFMGWEVDGGTIVPRYDLNDIGRVWVSWKVVAKALMFDSETS